MQIFELLNYILKVDFTCDFQILQLLERNNYFELSLYHHKLLLLKKHLQTLPNKSHIGKILHKLYEMYKLY